VALPLPSFPFVRSLSESMSGLMLDRTSLLIIATGGINKRRPVASASAWYLIAKACVNPFEVPTAANLPATSPGRLVVLGALFAIVVMSFLVAPHFAKQAHPVTTDDLGGV